ncbi:hypothetical protein ACHAWT_008713 [Skeletonema menzelii]
MMSSQSFDTGFLNAQDAADLDVELMSTPGFSLEQLMELAGLSVAEAVYMVGTEKQKKQRVLLVCGPGNNGGDGLVAARHLFHFGFQPIVVYPKRSTKPHFINLVQQLNDLSIPILDEIPSTAATENDEEEDEAKYDIIVDAIFGFSFRGTAPREPFATELRKMITLQTTQRSLLISVDVPSCWNVDGGDMSEGSTEFQPDVLISLTAPKLSAKKFTGRHFVASNEKVIDDDDDKDWALQYQAYLDEKEKARDDESGKEVKEGKEDDKEAEEGEEWAKEYAAYCAEKEKDFFEANKSKE